MVEQRGIEPLTSTMPLLWCGDSRTFRAVLLQSATRRNLRILAIMPFLAFPLSSAQLLIMCLLEWEASKHDEAVAADRERRHAG